MHRSKYICLNCLKVFKLETGANSICPNCHRATLVNVGTKIRFPKKKNNKQIKKILDDHINILRIYYQSLVDKNIDLADAIRELYPKIQNKLHKHFKGMNLNLAITRNIPFYDAELIKKYHDRTKDIFLIEAGLLKIFETTKDKSEKLRIIKLGQEFDKELRDIDFKLQELWKFDKDETMHARWFTQPLCKCPTQDNFERLGFKRHVINSECPIHGIFN